MMSRILNLIGRGRLTLVKDDKDVQRLQISEGNTGSDEGESLTDDIVMIGLFGLSSNAPEKTEVVLLRLGGDRSQTIAVGANHGPSRPKNLAPGDTMLYRAKDGARGAYIWLKDGVLQIDAAGGDVVVQNAATATIKASTKVRLETPKVETTGDFISRCDGTPVSMNALRDAYHAHKHTGGTISGNTGTTDHDA
jgi:phage gp45-like